jgi:hypothetical protein
MKLKLNKDNNLVRVKFDYDQEIIKKIKLIPASYWNPAKKYWIFPNESSRLAQFLEMFKDEYLIFESEIKDKPYKRVKNHD